MRSRGGSARPIHGLSIMGGVHSAVQVGDSTAGELSIGYIADLAWLSLGLRLRASTVNSDSTDQAAKRERTDYGAAAIVQRFVDFHWWSAALGITADTVWHTQTFVGERDIAPRSAVSAGFGVLGALETNLFHGLSLRLEAGPRVLVFDETNASDTASALTHLNWAMATGLIWRL